MNAKIYRFSGSHYEVGLQQGKAMRESIREGLSTILASEFMKSSKPKFVPMSLYYSMAKRRANNMLREDIFKYHPKQAQRMQGIADGAGVDLPTILFAQMLEMLVGCTTVALSQDRTTTSETIMAKNFDYVPFLAPLNFVCETKPTEGYRTLGFKMAPLPGMYDGMNEHGLARAVWFLEKVTGTSSSGKKMDATALTILRIVNGKAVEGWGGYLHRTP